MINCAAALERFYEFFLQVVFYHKGDSSETFYEEIWLPIKDRSKRQEDLFKDTFIEVIKHEHLQRRFRSRPNCNLHSTTIFLNTNFPSYDKIWTSNDFNVFVKNTAKEHEVYEVYLKQAIPILHMLQGEYYLKRLKRNFSEADNSIKILFPLVIQICDELNSSRDEDHKK